MTLVDSGALYALADQDDEWHGRMRAWWEAYSGEAAVPVTTLPEVTYLLQNRLGPDAEADFVRSIATQQLEVEALELNDVARAAELMADYRDLPLGFVDASIVAMAERLGVRSVLTTDRRHFSVVRPKHVSALRLEP